MANVMQYTKKTSGIDVLVKDDDTVTELNGTLLPNAVVTHNPDNTISVDLNGNGIEDIQPYPALAEVRITREPGWQGVLGWKMEILNWDASIDPSVYALSVYSDPEGQGYLFTTGAMVLDPVTGLWGTTCPAGFEPGQNNINFGMLYASLNYSNFTLYYNFDTMDFTTGGTGA